MNTLTLKTYKFLSNGNLPVPGVNDSQEFEDTKEAMVIMGMSDDPRGNHLHSFLECDNLERHSVLQ